MPEPELAIALVGFGNVARRFIKLLDEVAERLDFAWRLVAISTRHHGSVRGFSLGLRSFQRGQGRGGRHQGKCPSDRQRKR